MSNAASYAVCRRILSEWRWTTTQLKRLNPAIQHKPDDQAIIREGERTDTDVISVNVGPLVLHVPERGSHTKPSLFVYLEGGYLFSRDTWTRSSALDSTYVYALTAYFRRTGAGDLLLVHGAHYDYTRGSIGHPAFHLQLRGSLAKYGEVVKETFSLHGDVIDGIAHQLRTVRLPSAQLDPFSCIFQIAADQLLPKAADQDQRAAFNQLHSRAELCGPYCRSKTPSQLLPSSTPDTSYHCYRARHWYTGV